jgi:hypothetical protein
MAMVLARSPGGTGPVTVALPEGGSFETQFLSVVALNAAGNAALAAQVVDRALAAAPPGNAGWLLPVEPLLNVSSNPEVWASVLSRLRARAA